MEDDKFQVGRTIKVTFDKEQANKLNEAIGIIGVDEEYQSEIISKLQYVARDRAVRFSGEDTGFNVSIHANKIKSETNRSRIKQNVLDSYSDAFNSAGFESHVDIAQKSVLVFVPPVLDKNRNSFSLDDINNQADVISEIRRKQDEIINIKKINSTLDAIKEIQENSTINKNIKEIAIKKATEILNNQ
ncbi:MULTISPECIES: hypothetical protein [Vibrio]|uniref:hypothetical protein n=1 Tax=Vibrio TaxID=662 RepID=UPI00076AA8C6|nr:MULTISPECIES: hypothetical protein [Vibrio]